MLVELTAENFKSYQQGILPLSDLTLLIGANASGKSNLLEALHLLVWAASAQRLTDLSYADGLELRGSPSDLLPRGGEKKPIRFRAVFREPSPGQWGPELQQLDLILGLQVDASGLRVVEEQLTAPHTSGKLPLYAVVEPAHRDLFEIQVEYNNFARGGKKPKIPATNLQPIFTQLTTPARLASSSHQKSARLIPTACRHIIDSLRSTLFLDLSPRQMRGYGLMPERRLREDGSNLSAVLFHLWRNHKVEDVLAFVRTLPEQNVVGIEFIQAPRDEVMVQLIESFGGQDRPIEAAVLSDGTLRVLGIAAALLSVPSGSLVIIEELDNGVHPSRARALLSQIEAVAKDRGLRVLVTTHNPALMDALSPSALPNVVVCYRDASNGDSRLVQLAQLPRFPALVAQGPLGQLVTHLVLERFLPDLAPPRTDPVEWLGAFLADG